MYINYYTLSEVNSANSEDYLSFISKVLYFILQNNSINRLSKTICEHIGVCNDYYVKELIS